jgi:hypothetical protein
MDLDGRLLWECKQWNEALAAEVAAGRVPDTHMPQCQHQLLVTGAERLRFTVSDGTGERMVSAEVMPSPEWFQRLRDGWAQFEKDLAAYTLPPAAEPAPGAKPALPTLSALWESDTLGNFARRNRVLPIAFDEETRLLTLATTDVFKVVVLDQLRANLGGRVEIRTLLATEAQIEESIDKFYGFELSVDGILEEIETGEIDYPLEAVGDRYVPAMETGPKPARTLYRRLGTVELPQRVDRYPTSRYALLELQPDTGRRHQVRRHLAHVSHPIIGDSTYGKGRHNRLFAEFFGVQRLLLACVRLEFAHPVTGTPLLIDAEPGADFTALFARFGWPSAPPAASCIVNPALP